MAALISSDTIHRSICDIMNLVSSDINHLATTTPTQEHIQKIFNQLASLVNQTKNFDDYRLVGLMPRIIGLQDDFEKHLMKHVASNEKVGIMAARVFHNHKGNETHFDRGIQAMKEKLQKFLPSMPVIEPLSKFVRIKEQFRDLQIKLKNGLLANRNPTIDDHTNFHRYILKFSEIDDISVKKHLTKENLGTEYPKYWAELAYIEDFLATIQKMGPEGYGPSSELMADPLLPGCRRLNADFFLTPESNISIDHPALPTQTTITEVAIPGGPAISSSSTTSSTTSGTVTYEGIGCFSRPIQPEKLIITISLLDRSSKKLEFFSSDTLQYVRNRIANELKMEYVNYVKLYSGRTILENESMILKDLATPDGIVLDVMIDKNPGGRLIRTLPTGDPLQVTCRLAKGTVLTVNCFTNDTVHRTKCAAAELIKDCSWNELIIQFAGRPLEDHKLISEYSVASLSTLFIGITKKSSSSSTTIATTSSSSGGSSPAVSSSSSSSSQRS